MNTFETIEELATYIEEQQLVLLFIKTENCGVCDVMLRKVNYVLENYNYVEKIEILLQDMQEIAGDMLYLQVQQFYYFIMEKKFFVNHASFRLKI